MQLSEPLSKRSIFPPKRFLEFQFSVHKLLKIFHFFSYYWLMIIYFAFCLCVQRVKKVSRELEYSILTALSPLDGRYWGKVKDLAPFMSEYALIYYRVLVEVLFFSTFFLIF